MCVSSGVEKGVEKAKGSSLFVVLPPAKSRVKDTKHNLLRAIFTVE